MQSSRALVLFGAVCMLIGLVASDEHAPPLALYVPPAGFRPDTVPGSQTMPAVAPSSMTAPRAPVDSSETQMPIGQPFMDPTPQFLSPVMGTTAQSLPIAEEPASPFAFVGGFAGGLAAGVAFVYSLIRGTGQKVSDEAKKLELGALHSVAPNSPVFKSTALAPYLAAGDTLTAVLNQVTSGRAPMPPLGRHLRAFDTGVGRMRVVVNMSAMDDDELAKQFCYGLPGTAGPTGNFDPAGFLKGKDKLQVYRLREAELAHCRVGMLASLGFIVQESYHPLFSGVGGPAINQIPQLPVWLWAVMLGGIVASEKRRIVVGWAKVDPETNNPGLMSETKYRGLKEGYYPGDLGFDPLGLKPEDPKAFREMQEKELANGRLAMIAAAGFLAQEAVSGDTWGAYWA